MAKPDQPQGVSSRSTSLDVVRVYTPDSSSMLAALRVVLGLPRQLPPVFPDALLSVADQSNRYVPDRGDPGSPEGPGQEDAT